MIHCDYWLITAYTYPSAVFIFSMCLLYLGMSSNSSMSDINSLRIRILSWPDTVGVMRGCDKTLMQNYPRIYNTLTRSWLMWKCINPRPTGSCSYMRNALGFIIYHTKQERVYVFYKREPVGWVLILGMFHIIWHQQSRGSLRILQLISRCSNSYIIASSKLADGWGGVLLTW